MSTPFSIECEWSEPRSGRPELAHTDAFVEICIGDRCATRAENAFSGSVTARPLLSAYPLALWLAGSWWRLRWETAVAAGRSPPLDWRLSHELPASGMGFVWPALTFRSDGDAVRASMRPSAPTAFEPLRYIESFDCWLTGAEFERGVQVFVERVCARLAERGLAATPLQVLWGELDAERRDPEATQYRRLEAILGFDPDAADESTVDAFLALRGQAGDAARTELAYAAAGADPGGKLADIVKAAHAEGTRGRFEVPAKVAVQGGGALLPWERGCRLADALRDTCGFASAPLSDGALAGLLGLTAERLHETGDARSAAPLGLAIRDDADARFVFHRRNALGRRFEAARLIADHLLAPAADRWLPATDADTARQKAQRAFAAQFLCPIGPLTAFLDGDYSDERLEDAAEHFRVSERAVRSLLVNNRLAGGELLEV